MPFGNLQQNPGRAARLTPALLPILQRRGTDSRQRSEFILRQGEYLKCIYPGFMA
jgi:hypothetical protein